MNRKTVPAWREYLTSALTWHIVAFSVLLVLTISLATRLALDWTATDNHSTDVLATKQVQLTELRVQTAPLRGLDKIIARTRKQMKTFFDDRIPASYSAIESSMADLEVKSDVRLSRVQYTQGPPGHDLTQITMDAAISGSYPSIMHFVNSVERAKTFYVIQEMALTGEEHGQVNLRIEIATWLRPADAAASGLPRTPTKTNSPADSSQPGTEEN